MSGRGGEEPTSGYVDRPSDSSTDICEGNHIDLLFASFAEILRSWVHLHRLCTQGFLCLLFSAPNRLFLT